MQKRKKEAKAGWRKKRKGNESEKESESGEAAEERRKIKERELARTADSRELVQHLLIDAKTLPKCVKTMTQASSRFALRGIHMQVKRAPLYLAGRYKKYARDLPQTGIEEQD